MSLYLDNNGGVYQDPTQSGEDVGFSFFCWIKVDTNDQYHVIFSNGHFGDYGQGWTLLLSNVEDGQVLAIECSYVAYLESSLQIADNNWHFVGVTRRSTDDVWTIYLDEDLEEVGDSYVYSIGSESSMGVGGLNVSGSITVELSGTIAYVAYWEAVLSGANIANLESCTNTPDDFQTGLKVYLPFVSGDLLNNDEDFGDFSQEGTLTYSSDTPCAASSVVKTLNGLGIANVKTVNGLAIASVKTINGLA